MSFQTSKGTQNTDSVHNSNKNKRRKRTCVVPTVFLVSFSRNIWYLWPARSFRQSVVYSIGTSIHHHHPLDPWPPPSAQLPALLFWTPAAAAHSPHHHFPLLLLHARVDDDDGQFVLFSAIKQVLRTNERRTDGRTDAETDVCHTLPIFYSNSVQNLAMLLLLTYLSLPASIWRWRRREENITFHKLFMSIAATGKHMRPAPVLIHFVNTQVHIVPTTLQPKQY